MPRTVRTMLTVLSTTAAIVTACTPTTEPGATAPSGTSSNPAAPPSPDEPAAFTPILGRVVAAPIPVPATDGKVHLAYELLLTNVLGQDAKLSSVSVVAGDRTLLRLTGDQLGHWTRVLGDHATPTTTLGPGQTAMVWLDVKLDRSAAGTSTDIPAALKHEVSVKVGDPAPPLLNAAMTESIAATAIQTREPVAIAAPLAGKDWRLIYISM